MSMKELRMILKKEFIHIFRDKITLFLVLAMPIALVLLFGFTISSEIRNAKISVLDQANDTQSKQLCKKLSASGYFQIVSYPGSEQEADSDFKLKNIKLALVIPPHFEESLSREHIATLQVINDVSDLNVASILNNYVRAVVHDFESDYNSTADMAQNFTINIKMLYNPTSNSVYMFVPGIITLAREKETGTMRMLLITPVSKIHIIIGKVIPYMIISFLSTIIILVISVLVFKMPINGSVPFLLFLCVIFMMTAASFGMLISSVSTSQLDAMMITMMGLFLPTVLLSGFLFPLNSMPLFFQLLANIFPAKWFILAIKDVMIKGSGFMDIWRYMLVLFLMAVVFITFSIRQLDKRN